LEGSRLGHLGRLLHYSTFGALRLVLRTQPRSGARRSRRFNVQPAAGTDYSSASAPRTLKRT